MNRLIIFSFYDSQGIVDTYIDVLLSELKKYCKELCFVSNGVLKEKSNKKIESLCDKVIIRENKGYDAWAYKEALEEYDFENIKSYDEILCLNHTCFGPIYPLGEMFQKMETKTCDWWGLYIYNCKDENLVIGNHIPSFFIAYRKSLINNEHFKEFWDTMPEINGYNEDVKFFEQRQTPFFDKYGFKKEIAYDLNKYNKRTDNWPLELAYEILKDDKLPLLKRRPFFKQNERIRGEFYKQIIQFIKENTTYDITLIYENLSRTQDFNTLKKPNMFEIIWWHYLAYFSFRKKKHSKYKQRIKDIITKEEVIKIFNRKQ